MQRKQHNVFESFIMKIVSNAYTRLVYINKMLENLIVPHRAQSEGETCYIILALNVHRRQSFAVQVVK